jgi:uncharacterized membrane protein
VHLFELSPNCSLTPGAAAFFFVSVLAVALPVAGGCAVLGLWPVLPFTGLELLGLAVALRLSLRRGRVREFVRIDERSVTIGCSGGSSATQSCFARRRARVELRAAAVPAWPSRLLVGTMGRMVEIGAFLTESERRRLGNRLSELIPAAPGGPAGN